MLTQEQIDQFHENGFLVFNPGLDPGFIDTLVAKVQTRYDPDFQANPTFPTRLPDAWKQVEEVRQLATHPVILQALEQLLGRQVKPFQTLNFPTGTRQAAHSDTIHFNALPHGFMAGAWVALEDINEHNGPLVYYPGSHKLPEMTMQDFGLEPGYEHYREYEDAMRDYIEIHELKPTLGTISKGEVLIWHANLIHGGAPQTDPSLSRHSQVTHYYFADCEYYIPMRSTAEELHFREPEWIPTHPLTTSPVEPRKPGLIRRVIRRLRRFRNDRRRAGG